MIQVPEGFVKDAEALANEVKRLTEELATVKTAAEGLVAQANVVADTMVEQGLVPAQQKQAAVQSLMNHEQTLQALNKTAQMVRPTSMGNPTEKRAAEATGMAESDRKFLTRLNLI
jgi:polyhydroxyalkanoate synthesis regulator phasin